MPKENRTIKAVRSAVAPPDSDRPFFEISKPVIPPLRKMPPVQRYDVHKPKPFFTSAKDKNTQLEASAMRSLQLKPNNTGLPDNLKTGIETLSGFSMDDVKVHYNSDKPAPLNAQAYAQGTDIHIQPGQEQHLPHEAWHIVQQKQGRVAPTVQLNKTPINDDLALEREADVQGSKALNAGATGNSPMALTNPSISKANAPVQGGLEDTLTDLISVMGLPGSIIWAFVAILGIAVVVSILIGSKGSPKDAIGTLAKAKTGRDKGNTRTGKTKKVKSGKGKEERMNKENIEIDTTDNTDEMQGMNENGDMKYTVEELRSILGKPRSDLKTPPPKKEVKARPPVIPTEEQYNRKVENAARAVISEMKNKLNGRGHPNGSIDVDDGWRGYELMGRTKREYCDDIMAEVGKVFPQSNDEDRPYYNWVRKAGRWYGNYTRKARKDVDRQADVNIHFNF